MAQGEIAIDDRILIVGDAVAEPLLGTRRFALATPALCAYGTRIAYAGGSKLELSTASNGGVLIFDLG